MLNNKKNHACVSLPICKLPLRPFERTMSREIVMVNLDVLSQLQLGSRLRCRHGRFFELYPQSHGFRFVVPTMFLRWLESSLRHSDFQAIADVYATATNMLAQGEPQPPHERGFHGARVIRVQLA